LNEGATSASDGASCSRSTWLPGRGAQSQPLHGTDIPARGQFHRSVLAGSLLPANSNAKPHPLAGSCAEPSLVAPRSVSSPTARASLFLAEHFEWPQPQNAVACNPASQRRQQGRSKEGGQRRAPRDVKANIQPMQ